MRIVFQTDNGKRYQADVVDDRLTDIRHLNSPPPSRGTPPPPSRGSKPSDGENESQSGESESQSSTPPTPEDRVFIEQLQAVLVNNRARKQLRNKQKGSLDLKALVRTQTNSQSVFKQNNRKDSQRNYSVMLLVDESGSMEGEKAELAQELATNISLNLDKVGGVEVAVLGFSGNRVIEHKSFDNTGKNSLCCISEFCHGRSHCATGKIIQEICRGDGSNADMIAMEYALNHLYTHKAENSKPIFVMLSDGAPCNSRKYIEVITSDMRNKTFSSKFITSSTATSDFKTMHQLISRYPDVNAFGLGMLEGGQQVPKHKVVQDLKQTKHVLLDFLRTSIS